MAHVLAKLTDVEIDDVRNALRQDAAAHAEQGLFLEHLWQNEDAPEEVYFLFRADSPETTKAFLEAVHEQARAMNPSANLPEMTYLEDHEV